MDSELGNPESLAKFAINLDITKKICKSEDEIAKTESVERAESRTLPFKCEICQRKFSKSWCYKYHLKTHERRSHSCALCGKCFATKQALNVHSVVHNEVEKRPFSCSQCSKTFQTKQNLQCHENVHLGIKPFKCAVCKKSFREKSSLKKHTITHTKERQHSCPFCEKTFSQISSQQRHIVQFHNSFPQYGGFLPALGAEIVATELKILETMP